ncbi:MAG: tryptophanase [Firmicutes bacterium]|nr:tryptophanase [Bacillota bacterium]
MSEIRLESGEALPLELHKTTLIKKINLLSVDERLDAITRAGCNSFLLKSKEVFLDMLTDSGTNAMSINQQGAMFYADDAYAGSESFYRLEAVMQKVFKKRFFWPCHQGRACEHILSKVLVKNGDIVPTNYHFTTSRAHVRVLGGSMVEVFIDEAMKPRSTHPFKGNIDINKLKAVIKENKGKIAFVRLEAGTNLIGGQPISLQNIKETYAVCKSNKLPLVMDASLLQDNLYFMKVREKECENKSILEICNEVADNVDILYFSARKFGAARGGGICLNDEKLANEIKELIPLYEGFITYGGMSSREIEAIAVGVEESMDFDNISQAPHFIKYAVSELEKAGVPVITPAGGLGIHLNAREFLSHVKETEYQAGSLSAALYLVSGVRAMERGTVSEDRLPSGDEQIAKLELLRLALPRRVYTLSHVKFVVERVAWLYKNRELIGGLKWKNEPRILRFFFGELEAIGNWKENLVEAFKKDFPQGK